ncbi:NAD-dependent dehydratase [Cryobacterium roopkundense]|uniref:NAD-dependent dehydratase n=1 Tax=Cryobacterium roopkundense TaxID=1001240 RepID=A0A099J088_9MICO|nr:SDR family oxidoreductase [Cryobacterium roopkundense]KGJ71849.1 NAD-dependent dehydratase [Cryobacterium roopkundense]MBB5641412.1 uncharacterized protein YbjT (DUF2867 family) [Cryobacterium roopkundense]
MSQIAIIGGHGKVALHLARILTGTATGSSTGAAHAVTSFIRNPDHAAAVSATGATPLLADVETLAAEELADKLAGFDALVWSAGAGGGSEERTYAVDRDAAIRSMDAARQAGVKRYIMVSFKGSRADHGASPDDSMFAYYEAKAAADDYLRATDLSWTILGPSSLNLDAATGLISVGSHLPAGETSRENVALVAAAVLENPATSGRFIEFNDGDTPIATAIMAG